MTSKEALERKQKSQAHYALYELFVDIAELRNNTHPTDNEKELFKIIERDLDVLEKLETKTHLLFKDRKTISKEFDKWCEDNNAVNCSENMVTWFLSIKLREWLKNE